ncbi:heme/hemin ABC transporter substrate-binding protein [Algicella marina]|uniref:ABC transporter substrate-binding protein n=1 Tax=Algicella marina TaxID=2683284 RepID=A0A6P1T6D6_9RHOB|nr:ABC transporter substrate-binding protein [Algicella marina]QHQ37036.1 ABC transporter substrate-binding protein [Algicella marina]
MRLALLFTCLASAALAQPYERIVTAGGDLTEVVTALGAADSIVGIDSTSTYPAEITDLPDIGYVRALSAEGVLTLRPDLLIGAYDTGPEAVLGQLQAAGVQVEIAPGGEDAQSVPAKIRFVGDLLGKSREATALIAAYEADMAELATALQGVEDRPRVLFILSMQNGAPLVGGALTAADKIIALAGGVNVATGFDGYKPMNREAILAAAPDVILMMNGHADRLGGVDEVLALPEIALTPAGQNRRAITMDGMLLLGFGPRTPLAARELARALHPEDAAALGQ